MQYLYDYFKYFLGLCGIIVTAFTPLYAEQNCCSKNSINLNNSPWLGMTHISLDMHAETDMHIDAVFYNSNNFSAEYKSNALTGSLRLVDGHYLLAKGFNNVKPNYMIDVLDTNGMTCYLILSILQVAAPEGPEQLKGAVAKHLNERKLSIQMSTMSTTMHIPTPWQAQVSITPKNKHTVAFSIHLQQKEMPLDMTLSGTWQKLTPAPVDDDAMLLKGWTLYQLGVREIQEGNIKTLDYGTTLKDLTANTLGELKQQIKTSNVHKSQRK